MSVGDPYVVRIEAVSLPRRRKPQATVLGNASPELSGQRTVNTKLIDSQER